MTQFRVHTLDLVAIALLNCASAQLQACGQGSGAGGEFVRDYAELLELLELCQTLVLCGNNIRVARLDSRDVDQFRARLECEPLLVGVRLKYGKIRKNQDRWKFAFIADHYRLSDQRVMFQ